MNLYVLVWQATLTKKSSKNKIKKTIYHTDLVPITFGVLISKERKSIKASLNGICWRNTYVKILMDSGASALIIHDSYVSKNYFITRQTSANKWFTMAGSFSTSCEAKIALKMPCLIFLRHFMWQPKKVIMMLFFVEIYFGI